MRVQAMSPTPCPANSTVAIGTPVARDFFVPQKTMANLVGPAEPEETGKPPGEDQHED